MKRFCNFASVLLVILAILAFASKAEAQKETYTGTVISYGSGFNTRTVTRSFTLILNGRTSDERTQRLLNVLQEGSQETLLRELDDEELGRFSVGSNVGVPVNVVRENVVEGKRRLFIVFERWMQFAEIRGGYRSTDYPFGVIELSLDERTGKGEGTYIAAAQIRWKRDKKTNQYQVEVESFATFPARLMGVTLRGNRNR